MGTKLEELAKGWGYDTPEAMVEAYMFEAVMPAICTNERCSYSTEYEPDQDRGWCESCGTNTVVSASVLMGMV